MLEIKIIIVAKAFEKLEEFFNKQGSFEIVQSMDSIASNSDRLSSNIIQVDKFIVLVTEQMDFPAEVRALLPLLSSPSALLRIQEIVFFFKDDLNAGKTREYIAVVGNFVKNRAKEDTKWFAPHVSSHELKTLSFDAIYKELLGKSLSTIIDPKAQLRYREERGNESRVAFESTTEIISISPYDHNKVQNFAALKEILQKTENPLNVTALESLIPEYESLKLEEYVGLGYVNNKWILMTGDRRSGSTTHLTALAVSAVKANKSVLIIDFSSTNDVCEHLKVAAADHYILTERELLDNSLVMIEDKICVFSSTNREVLRTLLPYMQARPNVFDRELVLVSFDLAHMNMILGSVNARLCSLIISSLMFPSAVEKTLSVDVGTLKTLIWLNDNIASPGRRNKLTLELIKNRSKEAGREWKFLEPIFFEDFEMEPQFYLAVEEVL